MTQQSMGLALGMVAMVGAVVSAQASSLPPICFGFNQNSPYAMYGPTIGVPFSGGLTAHFTAPMSTSVEVVEVPVNFCWCSPPIFVDLHRTSALGVFPIGPPVGSFASSNGVLGGWSALTAAASVMLTAGSTYAVTIRAVPSVGQACFTLQYDPAAAQQLPYQFVGVACPPPAAQLPSSGTVGLMIRFRGIACAPGPLAAVAYVGSPCSTGSAGQLFGGLPGLGFACNLYFLPPISGTAYLFWSFGVSPVGTPIGLGTSCSHYLDPSSLSMLTAVGAEPLGQAPCVANVNTGWTFWVPSNPALAGITVGMQALAVGASGPIPMGAAGFGHSSNAVVFSLGYLYP
jgi:hypothetical protein